MKDCCRSGRVCHGRNLINDFPGIGIRRGIPAIHLAIPSMMEV